MRITALIVAFALTGLGSQVWAQGREKVLDLTVDRNKDRVPDELLEALNSVLAAKDRNAALTEFALRLPYSDRTRALQSQTHQLFSKLQKSQGKAADQIHEQIKKLTLQMAKDPQWKLVQGLDWRRIAGMVGHRKLAVGKRFPKFPPGAPASSPAEPEDLATGRFADLRKGDVLFRHIIGIDGLIGELYRMHYGHAGSYNGDGRVLESNVGPGVYLDSLQAWKRRGMLIALARSNQNSRSTVSAALDDARRRYVEQGTTPYNFNFFDKETDNALYCSQLVWKIHGSIGTDLDSNDLVYAAWLAAKFGALGGAGGAITGVGAPVGATVGAATGFLMALSGVLPDELFLSPKLDIYAEFRN